MRTKAPARIVWKTTVGQILGRGSGRLELPKATETVVAVDPKRGLRTQVEVEAVMDYSALPKGQLAFRINPYATVFLGREKLGTTPLPNIQVVAGKYRVRLVGPTREERRSVVVKPGAVVKVKANLE